MNTYLYWMQNSWLFHCLGTCSETILANFHKTLMKFRLNILQSPNDFRICNIFLIIYKIIHCLWRLTRKVSHATETLLIKNCNFIKTLFTFGCELSCTLFWISCICFLPFIWLTNARSPTFDKANLFLGARQTLYF